MAGLGEHGAVGLVEGVKQGLGGVLAVSIPRPPPLSPASDAPTDPPAEPMTAPAAAEESSFTPPPSPATKGSGPRGTMPQAHLAGWVPLRAAMAFVAAALLVGLTLGYLAATLVRRGSEQGTTAEIVAPTEPPAPHRQPVGEVSAQPAPEAPPLEPAPTPPADAATTPTPEAPAPEAPAPEAPAPEAPAPAPPAPTPAPSP